jgi:hypothetical protein
VTEPEERPRTWLPLVVAGSIAVLVVGGAIVTHLVRTDLAPEKQAAVAACEAEYKAQFPQGPAIIGGDIYSATEWSDLDATFVRLGYSEEQELTGEEISARDHAAQELVAAGADEMTIVWQLDDQSHATCVATMEGDTVTSATVTELAELGTSPSPSPSS